jgi:hypothetical protein
MRCGMAWQLLTRHHTATPILHLLAPVVRRNYPLLPRRQREVFGIASFVTRGCSQPLSLLFQDLFSPLLHAGCMSLSLACHSHRIPRFFSSSPLLHRAHRTAQGRSPPRCAISRPGRIFTCDRFRSGKSRWVEPPALDLTKPVPCRRCAPSPRVTLTTRLTGSFFHRA